MTHPCPLFLLPTDLINSMILPNIGLADIVNLDSACCSRKVCEEWRAVCRKAPPVDIIWQFSLAYTALGWLRTRGLTAMNVYVSEASSTTVDLILAAPNLAESVRIFGDPSFLGKKIEGNTGFADNVTRWSGCTVNNSKVSSGYYRNLEALRISYDRRTAEWATEAISNNPKLASLEITVSIAPGDEFFTALASRAATITQLTVNFAAVVEGESLLNRFARCCPRVQELCFDLACDIYEHWDTTPLQVGQMNGISQHCRELRKLRISKAEAPEGALRDIMLLCSKIQQLYVPDTTVTHRELLALSARSLSDVVDPNPLTHLSVSWVVADRNAIFTCAGLLEGLQSLELTKSAFAEWEKLPVALVFMSQLRTLCFQDTDSALYSDLTMTCDILSAVAENCPKLRSLEVTCCTDEDCGDGFAEVLSRCIDLEVLHLPDVMLEDSTLMGISVGSEDGAVTGACCLKTIRFYGELVSDEGMAALARHCPLLRTVDISGATDLTDTTLLALSQHCPHLRDVSIQDTEEAFSAAALEALCQVCPRLRSISVNNNQHSDGEMEALKQRLIGQGRNIVFA